MRTRIFWLALAVAGAIWAGACNKDSVGPPPPPPPPPPPGPPVVSDPVTSAPAGMSPATSILVQQADTDVVYVALPPGTAPAGRTAVIYNLSRGDSVSVAVAEGGFDPAPITALPGESVAFFVLDAGQNVVYQSPTFVVVARRPPVVVRTNPPPKKRDVPLNSRITVVFSEPIDAGSLNNSAIQLRAGSQLVAASLVFRDSDHVAVIVIPNAPLAPATEYTLTVSNLIRDLDGESLETSLTVDFTTALGGGFEEYFVDGTFELHALQLGDSVLIDYTVRVLNGDTTGIEGAIVRFRASTGTILPETTTSGLGGLTPLQWHFAGTIGVFPVDSNAVLSACASNSPTRCDQYWPILVIGYRLP